jgi:type II restriction enzyme
VDLALDPSLGEGLRSQSQIARRVTQGWIARELGCLSCNSLRLSQTAENTKARDFVCGSCDEPYELKSTSGRFTRWVLDGQFETLMDVITSGRTPNLLLMEYDRPHQRVRGLSAIRRQLLSPLAVVARPALRPPARRAGWKGCNIDLQRVPSSGRIRIVSESVALPWSDVKNAWSQVGFLVELRPETGGWIRDVLSCIDELPETFTLRDAYRFESRLARVHPENQHVRPKIRQQLQVLVKNGILARRGRGRYARLGAAPAEAG